MIYKEEEEITPQQMKALVKDLRESQELGCGGALSNAVNLAVMNALLAKKLDDLGDMFGADLELRLNRLLLLRRLMMKRDHVVCIDDPESVCVAMLCILRELGIH
eukprot:835989_1